MTNEVFLEVGVYIALVLFGIGLVYKMGAWFSSRVGMVDNRIPTGERASGMMKGLLGVFFSGKLFSVLKVFIVDVLFQGRVLKDSKDRLAWFMHILIFIGFMGLLIFHALGVLFSENWIGTVSPWMMLRNLFGLLAIAGLALAVIRRRIRPDIQTTGQDIYALWLLVIIMVSGFCLEGLKITSHTVFLDMVDEFGDVDDDLEALEGYWVANYGLVSPNVQEPVAADVLETGSEKNEDYCIECHEPPNKAFVSFAIAKAIKPAAVGLDEFHNFALYGLIGLRQPGHHPNLVVHLDHPFGLPGNLFVKHLLDV